MVPRVYVAAGSPGDDNMGTQSGKATTHSSGGPVSGAGHLLKRSGVGVWSAAFTAKPMHSEDVGPNLGAHVDVSERSVVGSGVGVYCMDGDGNVEGGVNPMKYTAGAVGSGAIVAVKDV